MNRTQQEHHTRISHPVDRVHVANLLREARSSIAKNDTGQAVELLDWVLLVSPESRPARKLYVDLLLAEGELDQAEAELARTELTWPNDPSLIRRRIKLLIAAGRMRAAVHLARMLLQRNPRNVRVLMLASVAAAASGERSAAIEFLHLAHGVRPADQQVSERLVNLLLADDRITEAEKVIAESEAALGRGRPTLKARTLIAQGRLLDAFETLQAEHDRTDPQSSEMSLRLLARIAPAQTVLHELERIDWSQPRLLLVAAEIWMSLGKYRKAIDAANAALQLPTNSPVDVGCRGYAARILTVANALTDDSGIPDRSRGSADDGSGTVSLTSFLDPSILRSLQDAMSQRSMAELWLTGLRGLMLTRQTDPKLAGRDPQSGPLAALLEDAAGRLSLSSQHEVDRSSISGAVATCHTLLGRSPVPQASSEHERFTEFTTAASPRTMTASG